MSVKFPLPSGALSTETRSAFPEGAFGVVQGFEAVERDRDSLSQRACPDTGDFPALVLLIFARDEAPVLERSLMALTAAVGPSDQVHVVADQCQDATADIAARFAAIVHVRTDGGPPGKGPALRWWLEQTRNTLSPEQSIVILDADTRLAPDFMCAIRRRLAQGEPVIQASIAPDVGAGGTVARLAAFSEIVEQQVFDAWCARLNWPVRLRGTGMAFRRWALEQAGRCLQTAAEDLELTLLLTSERIPITFARETYVIDPKPQDASGAARQRARWLKGQFQVLGAYPRLVLQLLMLGPPGWTLLSSALLKPKSLLVPLKILLTLLACLAVRRWGVVLLPLAGAGVLWLALDAIGLLYGLRFVKDKRNTLFALLLSPVYLAMWLSSLALAAFSRDRWLRTRPTTRHEPESGPGNASETAM